MGDLVRDYESLRERFYEVEDKYYALLDDHESLKQETEALRANERTRARDTKAVQERFARDLQERDAHYTEAIKKAGRQIPKIYDLVVEERNKNTALRTRLRAVHKYLISAQLVTHDNPTVIYILDQLARIIEDDTVPEAIVLDAKVSLLRDLDQRLARLEGNSIDFEALTGKAFDDLNDSLEALRGVIKELLDESE